MWKKLVLILERDVHMKNNEFKYISLSAHEIIDLLFEKSVEKGDYNISCKDSFLAIFACFSDEMSKRITK